MEIVKEIEDMVDIDEARDTCNSLMNKNQTYFSWEVDGVSFFEVDAAFETVLTQVMQKEQEGKRVKDFRTAVIDTYLMVLVEYK